MILFLDSSVVLRSVLRQPGALTLPHEADRILASSVLRVECWRSLDRLRVLHRLSSDEVAAHGYALEARLRTLEYVVLSVAVLDRASQPMAVALGTLDALHLASALLWRESAGLDVVLATHDRQLALAARANGLETLGSRL